MTAALIAEVEGFLAQSALESRSSAEILDGFATRLRAGGVPIGRAYLAWRLLHPLYLSHNLIYEANRGVYVERFRHAEGQKSEAYLRSPLKHVLEQQIPVFRRKLCDPASPRDYPVLDEFAERGFSDYVLFLIGFGPGAKDRVPGSGMIASFSADGPDGFSDEHMALLERLKNVLALAARLEMEQDMRETLARTYLGRSAGARVLAGQVQRGEGQSLEAVVWYCDLRGSTRLCETMGVDAYLPFLNDYFSVTAGPVTAHGGEVLDFIGDAVLAIFPVSSGGLDGAMDATVQVLRDLEAFRLRYHNVLGDRATVAEVAGVAIDIGSVMYGNIGIPERLTFSVIGPTVNKVSRIERLTKTLQEPVLVTPAIAKACNEGWVSRGLFELDGVAAMEELFGVSAAFRREAGLPANPARELAAAHA